MKDQSSISELIRTMFSLSGDNGCIINPHILSTIGRPQNLKIKIGLRFLVGHLFFIVFPILERCFLFNQLPKRLNLIEFFDGRTYHSKDCVTHSCWKES